MNARIIIWSSGLLIRIIVIFYIARLGADIALDSTDSLGFYNIAKYIANGGNTRPWEIGWGPYVNVVGLLMGLTFQSIMAMCLLSVFGWLASAIVVDKGLSILHVSDMNRSIAAAIMSWYPTCILVTTLPLREPFQMLGVSLIGYSMIMLVALRQYRYWSLFLAGFVLAGSTHMAMASMVIASVASMVLYWAILRSDRLSIGRLSAAIGASAFAVAGLITIVEMNSFDVSNGILSAVESYQQTGATLDARAQYKSAIDAGSGLSSLIFIMTGFAQYLLEPFPWRIATVGDLVVFGENIFRFGLIILAVIGIRRSSGPRRMTSLIFLYLFLVAELLWSLGTINWGTAARHHAPQIALLIFSVMAGHPVSLFRRSATNNQHLVRV